MNNDKRTHGLWEATASVGPEAIQLTSHINADVVIIGGGYTGCSAALHLAESGRHAVILEAVDIGFGGAGRNVGLVNAGLWVMPEELPRQLGEKYGERLLNQLGTAPSLVFDIVERHGIACELHREGTLHCAVGAAGAKEIAERARQWQARGADVELLDVDAACIAIGSKAYTGALLDRRAGTIQPLAYARGLANAAVEAGAKIFSRSPAVAASSAMGSWTIATSNGSVTAPFVIIATDAYASGPWAGVREEQVMLPYFNLASSPLSDNVRRSILPGRQGAWDTKGILSSFRFDAEGRLIFGSVGALRRGGTGIHRGWAKRELYRIFPQLAEVEFEHEWFGWIGMTGNAIPRFHQHARNVFSISGYNGRGIAPGTTMGRDLARLAVGEMDPEDFSLPLSAVEKPSMRGAREALFEFGSQAAHLIGSRF